MSALAVIVPVLDEAATLPALLDALAVQNGVDLELIVADGGSTDASAEIAAARGATVVRGRRGRGRQMNAGARASQAPYLLFLHADSRPEAPDQLARALAALRAETGRVAGHFPLRFERTQRGHAFLYRYMEAKSATGRAYAVNGDQGLLIARAWFRELGGFDERLPFLEDQRIAARIRTHGRWLTLPGRLVTSARRFEREGPRRRYWLMAVIMAAYAAELEDFFERAPGVYRAQGETGRLLLTPYFRLLRRLMRERGVRASLRAWYAVGGFAAGQAWQPMFAADVALAPLLGGRRPATAVHDRLLAPLIDNPAGRALAGLATAGVGLGLLAPWCRWRERHALRWAPETGP